MINRSSCTITEKAPISTVLYCAVLYYTAQVRAVRLGVPQPGPAGGPPREVAQEAVGQVSHLRQNCQTHRAFCHLNGKYMI